MCCFNCRLKATFRPKNGRKLNIKMKYSKSISNICILNTANVFEIITKILHQKCILNTNTKYCNAVLILFQFHVFKILPITALEH